MIKKYTEPYISIQKFVIEDVVTSSGIPYVDKGEMAENVVQDELP